MLTLKASLEDIVHRPPELQAARCTSHLSFFRNSVITNDITTFNNGLEIWAGEAEDPYKYLSSHVTRCEKTTLNQDFDGIRISLLIEDDRQIVTICRTAAGTSPIYLSAEGSQICISWRFEDVVANISKPKANIKLCRKVLKHGKTQSREQVIDGVFALWAGERVSFSTEGLAFTDCQNISVWQPASFSDRAQASTAFLETVSSVLRPILTKAIRPLLEFSGGMDSTCVALAASSIRKNLESFGVIHPGGVGRQQLARRKELTELLNLVDYTAPASFALPVRSLLLDECQITPNDEVYRVCMMNVLHEHALHNVDVAISGLGGDELTKAHTYMRWKWEVPGHVCASSIGGGMSHADMYMRRGIWLFNPLCHPKVVNLCRAMPLEMRTHRLLHRLTMARSGLSDGYMTPRYHETFANVLLLESIEGDFDDYFEDSILGKLGLLDISGLLTTYNDKTDLGPSVEIIGKIYEAAKLDLILKKYLS